MVLTKQVTLSGTTTVHSEVPQQYFHNGRTQWCYHNRSTYSCGFTTETFGGTPTEGLSCFTTEKFSGTTTKEILNASTNKSIGGTTIQILVVP